MYLVRSEGVDEVVHVEKELLQVVQLLTIYQ